MMPEVKVIKVVLLGDKGVGKTSLAKTLTEGFFPSVDSLPGPSMSDSFPVYKCSKETIIRVGDNTYSIHIFDLRDETSIKEHLSQANFCYLCFDMSNQASFDSIRTRWASYLRTRLKTILVGLKLDLVYEPRTRDVLESQGLQTVCRNSVTSLASEIQACHYVEISALKYLGIEQLKDKTIFGFIDLDKELQVTGKRRCSIM